MTKEQLLSKAIDLPPIERAQLIEDLLDSFNLKQRKKIDKIWAKEAKRRMNALKEVKIDAIPAQEVFDEINR